MLDANESSMPGRANPDNPQEMEEEQRIFYVAITRATDTLVICNTTLNKQRDPLTTSRFVAPILNLLETRDEPPKPVATRPENTEGTPGV